MMKTSEDILTWEESLEAFKPDYYPVKCFNILGFYTLRKRTVVMTKQNTEPIADMHYALYSKAEGRYYFKQFRGYDLDTLFFYRPTLTFSGEDPAVKNLRRYVNDGMIWLLFTQQQIVDMTSTLKRLWKFMFSSEGKLDYKIYLELLKTSLEYEDYKNYGRDLIGFVTVCKQYEDRINNLWQEAYNKFTSIK